MLAHDLRESVDREESNQGERLRVLIKANMHVTKSAVQETLEYLPIFSLQYLPSLSLKTSSTI